MSIVYASMLVLEKFGEVGNKPKEKPRISRLTGLQNSLKPAGCTWALFIVHQSVIVSRSYVLDYRRVTEARKISSTTWKTYLCPNSGTANSYLEPELLRVWVSRSYRHNKRLKTWVSGVRTTSTRNVCNKFLRKYRDLRWLDRQCGWSLNLRFNSASTLPRSVFVLVLAFSCSFSLHGHRNGLPGNTDDHLSICWTLQNPPDQGVASCDALNSQEYRSAADPFKELGELNFWGPFFLSFFQISQLKAMKPGFLNSSKAQSALSLPRALKCE